MISDIQKTACGLYTLAAQAGKDDDLCISGITVVWLEDRSASSSVLIEG